jgi:hypothetical protein
LVVLAVFVMLWLTRDTTRIGSVVPRQQHFVVVVHDLLDHQETLAASPIWDALPAEANLAARMPDLVPAEGTPGWVANNLIGRQLLVTGRDDQLLCVTRMSRVGRLLEPFSRFLDSVAHDEAGGLALRHAKASGMYYAVRGRLLILSPSRDTLIQALTLRPEDRVADDVLARLLDDAGTEQLRGVVDYSASSTFLQGATFALRTDETTTHLQWRATLQPAWRQRLAPVLDGLRPERLPAPPPGLVQVSANLGGRLDALTTVLRDGDGTTTVETDEDDAAALAERGLALLGLIGPDVTLSWTGTAFNEIVPAPLLLATAATNPDVMNGFLAQFTAPEGAHPHESVPRYDAATGRVRLPMAGGTGLEPTFLVRDARLVAASSPRALEALPGGDAPDTLDREANLYVRAAPTPVVDALGKAGALFAESGLLRGMTADAFAARVADWENRVAGVSDVTVWVSAESGRLAGDLIVARRTLESPADE